jgi:hypothetical protein
MPERQIPKPEACEPRLNFFRWIPGYVLGLVVPTPRLEQIRESMRVVTMLAECPLGVMASLLT